jgi:hypothetical protein
MILAIVEIPLPGPKRAHDAVIAQSLAASAIFRDVPGLNRKYFLNGDAGGAGLYEFESRAAAEAWFNDGWADWMEGRFGVRPTLRLYDVALLLDNRAGARLVDGVFPHRDSEAADKA